MTAAIIALAIGVWVGFCAAVVLAIYLSARHERMWEAEKPEALTDTPIWEAMVTERHRAELDGWGRS